MINVFNIQRAGVFQEEIDNTITSQPAQVLYNKLIMGVSRTGTDFNTPILISNSSQSTLQFGEIDRVLEKKKCFFHRAIQRGLKTGAVYALNLLYTNENDTLEFQTLSASSSSVNRAKSSDEYGKFFDRTTFWTKSTEALNTVANTNVSAQDKFLHITNFSDKKRTLFIYKSAITGFDVKASDWYGSVTKVPTYIHPDSYMSEYFVTVMIVDGDWSNYTALGTDPEWSSYFSTKGLTVSKVNDFINNPKVNIIGLYDTSLLPYFRDKNGRNYYIETVINANTSATGIFCAVDTEMLESDYPKGLIDLIGNNLASDTDDLEINFLSYNENIGEKKQYVRVNPLRRNSGVLGVTSSSDNISYLTGDASSNDVNTTPSNTNFNINGSNLITVSRTLVSDPATFTVLNPQYTIDDVYYNDNTSYNFSIPAPLVDEIWVCYADSDGIHIGKDDTGVSPTSGLTLPSFITDKTITLFYLSVDSGSNAVIITDVSYRTTGGLPHRISADNGSSNYNITLSSSGTNNLTLTFTNTDAVITTNKYVVDMMRKYFNDLKNNIFNNSKSVIVDSNREYVYLNDGSNSVIFTNYTNISDASLTITTVSADIASKPLAGDGICFIYNDDTFVFGDEGVKSQYTTSALSNDYGVATKYSQFYSDYYNGIINDGDYFHANVLKVANATLTFYPKVGLTPAYITGSLFPTFNNSLGTTKIRIIGSINNDGVYNVTAVSANMITLDITEDLVSEAIIQTSDYQGIYTGSLYIVDEDIKYYLDSTFINGNLSVDLRSDKTLQSDTDLTYTDLTAVGILLFSEKSNFVQTVDIDTVLAPNEIVVDSVRYGSDLKVGDYLLAYYDENALVAVDEMPRKITKILEKKQYKINNVVVPNKAVVKTDKEILISTDNQTKRLTPIYDYVTGYKGLMLSGFKMSSWSIPDGTESKFNQITSIIAKDTPLFNALTNRNLISWRYLVDCWGGGLVNASKQVFVDLVGKRKTAVALLNMPSIAEFKKSTDPSFVDENGFVNMEFVADGADLSKNPSDRYTYGSGDGQSYSAYFTPNFIINDDGRPLSMPPALEVQNTFVRKFTTNRSGVFGWTISAGVENGLVLDIVDIERHYSSESELIALNKMGANHITFTKNIGFYIDNDNTAQQAIKSALSVLHIREALIELEIELYNMLVRFNWKFNTPEIRDEIKRKADAICQRFKDNDAIYDFRNIIDESNNTQEVIDNESGILDTFVEPVRGLKIILNRITVFRTGQIASSGF